MRSLVPSAHPGNGSASRLASETRSRPRTWWVGQEGATSIGRTFSSDRRRKLHRCETRANASSELEPHLDLPHSRRVGLRAHPAEVRVGDVRLDASEDDGVEQIEHVDAEPELHPGDVEIAAHAEVLVEEARVAQIEGQGPRSVA